MTSCSTAGFIADSLGPVVRGTLCSHLQVLFLGGSLFYEAVDTSLDYTALNGRMIGE
jgi:hypothetical protein